MKYHTVLIMFIFLASSCSKETAKEKNIATTNTQQREIKKKWNRAKESMCGKLTGDNKIQCLEKEAANRLEETSDVIEDKVNEIRNDVDYN